MKNIITATIEFYFKGEKYTPSITIELGNHMSANACLPNFHALIATENNIDLYSYEYEMMLSENIKISHPEGLIAEFIVDGILDTHAFKCAWLEHRTLKQLQEIAKQHMEINDLQQHPELEKALRQAFRLGQHHASKD